MIKTNCVNCAFAIKENSIQTGCVFNRLSKFESDAQIQSDELGNQFYTINRLCTYYRDIEWSYTKDDITKVQKESALKFDAVFNCNNVDQKQSEIIKDFLSDQKYYLSKINFILLHDYNSYDSVKSAIIDIAQNHKNIINISICDNVHNYMNHLALKSRNAYHVLIDPSKNIDPDLFCKVNNYVNEDLNKFLVCNIDKQLIISNMIYRAFYTMDKNIPYLQIIENIKNHCISSNMYIEL